MSAPMSLISRIRLARLALVVPPHLAGAEAADFAAHGADLLVLARGNRGVDEAAAGLEAVRKRLFGLQTLVAADDMDVAKACGADVVFLKSPGWRPFGIKRPHEFTLLGRSISGTDEADKVDGDPFEFGFVGPAVVDGDANRVIADMATEHPPMAVPLGPVWFAAGGISSTTVADVLAAGARRAVVSTAVFSAGDPFRETAAIAESLAAAWRADAQAEDYGRAAFG